MGIKRYAASYHWDYDMRTGIFKEIRPMGKGEEKRIIHKVLLPEVSDKGFYRTIGSLNAFNSGDKKNSTALEKSRHRSACCWGPGVLYYYARENEWEREQERIANDPILADLDERQMETIHHGSLWNFYQHIGFDYKRRRYVK